MTNTKPTANFSALLTAVDEVAKDVVRHLIANGDVAIENAAQARVVTRDAIIRKHMDERTEIGLAFVREAMISSGTVAA